MWETKFFLTNRELMIFIIGNSLHGVTVVPYDNSVWFFVLEYTRDTPVKHSEMYGCALPYKHLNIFFR